MSAKILRVNMATLETCYEETPEKYFILGGRALTSQVIADEVVPTCDPLGDENKLVFAPGILTGTRAPSSGRLSVGAKSPMTGTIKEANAGGITAQKIASLGIKCIIVEGKPLDGGTYLLHLSEEGAVIKPAAELAGMGTYQLNESLWEQYGSGNGIICIGPAGEQKMRAAGVSTNDGEGYPGRFAARGGLGAVMGSKGLKAIVVQSESSFAAPVADKDAFMESVRKFSKCLLEHPVSGQALPALGTAVLVNIINEAGAFPAFNYREGRFAGADKISGEALAGIVQARGGKGQTGHACMPGCIIKCSNVYPDEQGEVLCSPVEYESIWALGANLGIDNLDFVAKMNRVCNDVGLDTMDAGSAMAMAMEAGKLPFGDGEKALAALEEVGQGTELGKIIGQGTAFAGKEFGVERIPVVKGQSMSAYDPRASKALGVTYATSPMGADHTAGNGVAVNILRIGGFVEPFAIEGQIEASRELQIGSAIVDATGLCLFVAFALGDNPETMAGLVGMLNAKLGVTLTPDAVGGIGVNTIKAELLFNRAAGFTNEDDRLPDFMVDEKLAPHNQVYDVPGEKLDETFGFLLATANGQGSEVG